MNLIILLPRFSNPSEVFVYISQNYHLSLYSLYQIRLLLQITCIIILILSTSTDYVTLLQHINTATQLNGLYLYDIPNECVELLQSHFPLLSNLQEIVLDGKADVPCASLLPQISKLSNIKYFGLRSFTDTGYEKYFLQIMNSNTDSLKGLELSRYRVYRTKQLE